jgi:gamma-glutamyltranspeptidase/glutathione hydrolase
MKTAPASTPIPTSLPTPVNRLISKEYAATRRRAAYKLHSKPPSLSRRQAVLVRGSTRSLRPGDTIYLTVADRDRNMVSFIQSNYWGFG